MTRPEPARIRALRAENPQADARSLARAHGLAEAELVAAHAGPTTTATAIDPCPDRLMPHLAALGDLLAVTRNESCAHERHGAYLDYRGGDHAALVVGPEIDLRLFPAQWVHRFALAEPDADGGMRRSLQVFDAAGDAMHKIVLPAGADPAAFDRLVAALRRPDQPRTLVLAPRRPVEPARADPSRAAALRAGWDRMTDTHQFLSLVRAQKMNRLGAYRVAGAPHARALAAGAVTEALCAAAAAAIPVMIFVGNRGCIQIHGGPIARIVPPAEPWLSIDDPRFRLHLRTDRIAEVWRVAKPSRAGLAVSVEAFDAEGALILQIFGSRREGPPAAWDALVDTLPLSEEMSA